MNIKYSLFLWLTVLCIVIVSLYACNSVQNKKPHNVLVIHSFNKNDSWVEDLNKGIKEAFDDENLDTQVKEYYLSTELRTEEAKQNEINKLLDSYSSKPLDLIIVADDDCFSSFFATVLLLYKNGGAGCAAFTFRLQFLDQTGEKLHRLTDLRHFNALVIVVDQPALFSAQLHSRKFKYVFTDCRKMP